MKLREEFQADSTSWSAGKREFVTIAAIILFVLIEFAFRGLAIEECGAHESYAKLRCFSIYLYGPRLMLPVVFVVALLGGRQGFSFLGIDRSIVTGFALAALATSTMGVGLALSHQLIALLRRGKAVGGPSAARASIGPKLLKSRRGVAGARRSGNVSGSHTERTGVGSDSWRC